MLARRRSQETPTAVLGGTKLEDEELKYKQAIRSTDENANGFIRHRRNKQREEHNSLLEMINNVRPSSAVNQPKLLRHDSVKTDLKKIALRDSHKHNKKLEVKVQQLIEQRKRLVTRLQEESLLTDNGTESTQPLIPSVSKTSVESDVEKQVNFAIVPKSEGKRSNKLELIDCKGTVGEEMLLRNNSERSAVSILLEYLLERPFELERIFSGPDSSDSFKVNITLRGRPKSLVVRICQMRPWSTVEICRSLITKAAEFLEESNSLTDLFEMFVAVRSSIIEPTEQTLQTLSKKDCRMYLRTRQGDYLRVISCKMNSVEIESISGSTAKTLSVEYLKFLYGTIYLIEGMNSELVREHLKLNHHSNHFNVVTLTLRQPDTIHIMTTPEEQTHLVVTDSRTKEICGFLQPNKRSLRLSLQRGEYELYVSSIEGVTRLTYLSSVSVKLMLRHKEQYRRYCEQLVNGYLQEKLNDVCSCSEPTVVRCELFIGFAADVVCNPTNSPLNVTLEYSERVLCDLSYRKNFISYQVSPHNHYVVPLRKLAQLSSCPSLPQQLRRI